MLYVDGDTGTISAAAFMSYRAEGIYNGVCVCGVNSLS